MTNFQVYSSAKELVVNYTSDALNFSTLQIFLALEKLKREELSENIFHLKSG